MKKTISINIGGIIFHIEEDGYDKLKNYLESVNKYFSRFEDSAEIISDIEGRIAELFLLKLTDGRQTLNIEDVSEVINTMGTTSDFEATIEEDETDKKESSTEEPQEETKAEEEPASTSASEPKKLYRDTKRGILGGVASGIAYYFSIDPLWIRLLFLALLLSIFFAGVGGIMLVGYIIMWIVIPPNDQLEENQKVKKLYRNPEDRVLGGVAGGVGAYFGVDAGVIRLIFVVTTIFAGSGLLAYIILWMITPEAKSITEKMQMSGKPINLKNIEDNVKKSFKVKDGEETPLVKVLLFPFRLIAIVISGIAKALGPLLSFAVDIIRIAFGAILVISGFSIVAGMIIMLLSVVGLDFTNTDFIVSDIPLDLIKDSLDGWMVTGVFLGLLIPAIGMALLGLVIIIKRRVANSYIGWSLFAIWIFGIMMAAITIPRFVKEFSDEDTIRLEESFEVTQATPTLTLNDLGENTFDGIDLRLRGHDDSVYQVVKRIESRGSDRTDAEENAQQVIYTVAKQGEDFVFDSRISFPEDGKYRFQKVDATMYIPYGKVFRMDKDLTEILSNTIRHYGFRNYQIEGNEWTFSKNGTLECVTCPTQNYSDDDADTVDDADDFDFDRGERSYSDSDEINYPIENFDELRVGALIDIEVRRTADEYDVTVYGQERDLDDVFLNQVGSRLEISFKKDDWKWWSNKNDRRVKVIIAMPELSELEVFGATEGEITGFQQDKMDVEMSGITDLYMNCSVRDMKVSMSGDSELNLNGEGDILDIEISGAAELNSFDYSAQTVEAESSGASTLKIYSKEQLKVNASGMSDIKYRGSPNTDIDRTGAADVSRY
ncbi:MAG: PspC domain-containing protein [Cyclobacteriaceae bacterium]